MSTPFTPNTPLDIQCLYARLSGTRTTRQLASAMGVCGDRVRQRLRRCIKRLLHAQERWAAAEDQLREMAAERRLLEKELELRDLHPEPIEPAPLTIHDLHLSTRPHNALEGLKFNMTVDELAAMTRNELVHLNRWSRKPELGDKSIEEIAAKLDALGVAHRLREPVVREHRLLHRRPRPVLRLPPPEE